MADQKDVFEIVVRLVVDGEQSLFIALGDDGGINRMGTGAEDNQERDLFIGKTDHAIFLRVRQLIGPELLAWFGKRLADPQPLGKICELTVALKHVDGTTSGTAFRYGLRSLGPPPEVVRFVLAVVDATEPWYQQFKAAKAASRKTSQSG